MRRQTKACITKSSCEMSALLAYQTAESGKFLLTFQNKLWAPSSNVKNPKQRTETTEVHRPCLFLGLCPLSDCLQNRNISETGSVSVFRQRSNRCNLHTFSLAAHHRKSNKLGCALENRSHPRGIMAKWLLKIKHQL